MGIHCIIYDTQNILSIDDLRQKKSEILWTKSVNRASARCFSIEITANFWSFTFLKTLWIWYICNRLFFFALTSFRFFKWVRDSFLEKSASKRTRFEAQKELLLRSLIWRGVFIYSPNARLIYFDSDYLYAY